MTKAKVVPTGDVPARPAYIAGKSSRLLVTVRVTVTRRGVRKGKGYKWEQDNAIAEVEGTTIGVIRDIGKSLEKQKHGGFGYDNIRVMR